MLLQQGQITQVQIGSSQGELILVLVRYDEALFKEWEGPLVLTLLHLELAADSPELRTY